MSKRQGHLGIFVFDLNGYVGIQSKWRPIEGDLRQATNASEAGKL